MKIEFGKAERGIRAILVDDVYWGVISQHRHGSKGSSYTFQDIIRTLIRDPSNDTVWAIHTGQLAKRNGQDDRIDLDDRLHDAVAQMIDVGVLRDPESLRDEIRKHREEAEARQTEIDEAIRAAFKARAKDAIGVDFGFAIGEDGVDELSNRIVEAMRWAQSQ